jgi:hypothetical protein
MKRYYPFGEEAEECWRNSPNLRKLLNPKWLKTQAQNQLLWKAHPLFNPICLNNPSITVLETALRRSSQKTLRKIKRHLKDSVNNWHDFLGFFAEIFIMLSLISRDVTFNYRPGEGGADFIVPAMNNLRIEVTSIQAERWDGNDEATTRWENCLPIYKTGLLLQLIWTRSADDLTSPDWIEGFQCFENILKDKETFEKGREITLSNRQGTTLAEFKIISVYNNRLIPTQIFPTPQAYHLDMNEETRKFKSFITQRIRYKKNQIVPFGIICLDTSGWTWRQSMVKDINDNSWDYFSNLLQKELKQSIYSSVIALVLFQKDFSNNNIQILPKGVIPNPNSKLTKNNRQLFQKALDIFR